MIYTLIFIFGASIGSFLNVVILRYNSGKSIFKGGSYCFFCSKKLKWYELAPILSFLVLRGRCRGCRSKISWQYPVVEIVTGSLFLLIFNFKFSLLRQGFEGQAIFSLFYVWLLASLLIVIAVYDFRHKIIPNKIVWLFNGLVLLLVLRSFNEGGDFWLSFLSGLAFSSFFAFLWLVSRGKWMGFGDAKLALGLGWLLGPTQTVSAFLISFWLGAVVGIILMIFAKSKYSIKSQIPFGPFLIIGALVSFLLDINILNWIY